MPVTEHKLQKFLEERERVIKEVEELKREPMSPGLQRRILGRLVRARALNARIATLGQRNNLVRVWGKYIIRSGNLTVTKDFQMYYTDIAQFDARRKAEMYFMDGLAEIHTEIITTGRPIEMVYNKG